MKPLLSHHVTAQHGKQKNIKYFYLTCLVTLHGGKCEWSTRSCLFFKGWHPFQRKRYHVYLNFMNNFSPCPGKDHISFPFWTSYSCKLRNSKWEKICFHYRERETHAVHRTFLVSTACIRSLISFWKKIKMQTGFRFIVYHVLIWN